MRALLVVVCVLMGTSLHGQISDVIRSLVLDCPSFEHLCGKYDELLKRKHLFSSEDQEFLTLLEENYNENSSLTRDHVPTDLHIPHVLHIVWVGPRPFPRQYVDNLRSWQQHHPTWTMKFWTDSHKRACPIEGMEKQLLGDIHFIRLKPLLTKIKNVREAAALIGYEVVFNQGGVFVDPSMVCDAPFEEYHAAFDFYAGLCAPHADAVDGSKVVLSNRLFGAKRHHPILKETIEEVARYGQDSEKLMQSNIEKAFTVGVRRGLNIQDNRDVVLPSSYFFAHKIFKQQTIEELYLRGLVMAHEKELVE